MRTLGLEIRKRRKESGIKVADFAKRVGVSKVAVFYWERDMRRPSVDRIVVISNVLSCDATILLDKLIS